MAIDENVRDVHQDSVTADLEYTQNSASYMVFVGQIRCFYSELHCPTRITRTCNYGSHHVARCRSINFDHKKRRMTQKAQNMQSYLG